jgi:hypothetical protein
LSKCRADWSKSPEATLKSHQNVLGLIQGGRASLEERTVGRKLFGTIFGRRKPVMPVRRELISDFKVLKPAKDIAEFEYPPESSFYKNESSFYNSDEAETARD